MTSVAKLLFNARAQMFNQMPEHPYSLLMASRVFEGGFATLPLEKAMAQRDRLDKLENDTRSLVAKCDTFKHLVINYITVVLYLKLKADEAIPDNLNLELTGSLNNATLKVTPVEPRLRSSYEIFISWNSPEQNPKILIDRQYGTPFEPYNYHEMVEYVREKLVTLAEQYTEREKQLKPDPQKGGRPPKKGKKKKDD